MAAELLGCRRKDAGGTMDAKTTCYCSLGGRSGRSRLAVCCNSQQVNEPERMRKQRAEQNRVMEVERRLTTDRNCSVGSTLRGQTNGRSSCSEINHCNEQAVSRR